MKKVALLLLAFLPSGTCFNPRSTPSTTATTTTTTTTPTRLWQSNKLSDISHELEELGQEVKPHVIDHEARPIGTKDSVVHRLRRELHEKDKHYHAVLDELERLEQRQASMKDLKVVMEDALTEIKQQNAMLRHNKDIPKLHEDTMSDFLDAVRDIHDNLVQANAFAVAWETAEVELWHERKEHDRLERERESVRKLLWQATKLTGRRVKNLFRRVFGRGE